MELPIIEPAPVVPEHAAVFRDLFENQCQVRPFQHDLTGLMVLPHKRLANMVRGILDSTDKTNRSRFCSEAPWRADAVKHRRLRLMLPQTNPQRRRRRESLLAIEDTLCAHVGSLFDYVERHDNHREGTSPLAHHPVTSVYVSGPVRVPVGRRLYRRDEALTPWDAAVATSFPELTIPPENKARTRLHKQVDPLLLQDPEFRARHEPCRTKSALAIALVEEAIRSKVPFGVVVCDAWYLAEDLVRVWGRRRKDWISLRTTNRLRDTASCHLRDVNGGALQLPSPHMAVEDLVPLSPATADRAVTVGEHTYGCFTLAVRVPGLGKVRIVVSVEDDSWTSRHVGLVTNRVDWSAAQSLALYLHRWPTEIVQTQRTKRRGFPLRPRGDHVANLHLAIGDDDTIDAPCHQWSALGTRELVQGGLHLPAKRFESLGQDGDVHLLLRLNVQLAQLLRQAWWGLGHRRSCALELVAPNELGQIDLQHAGLLPFERREGFTEGRPAGLAGLGQPFAAVRTPEFMSNSAGSVRIRQRSCQTNASRVRAGAKRAVQRSPRAARNTSVRPRQT